MDINYCIDRIKQDIQILNNGYNIPSIKDELIIILKCLEEYKTFKEKMEDDLK